MALYKLTIKATKPYNTHFREADILFTAPNDNDAIARASGIRKLFTDRAEITTVHKVS